MRHTDTGGAHAGATLTQGFMPCLWREILLCSGEKWIHRGCKLNSYWAKLKLMLKAVLLELVSLASIASTVSWAKLCLSTEWESQINISLF